MENQREKLFDQFPGISTKEWEDLIIKDLKGADYAKKLIWQTREGFLVKPYYRKDDLNELSWLNCLPGNWPFVRGNNARGNAWLVRQEIQVNEISDANAKALDVLMKGVDSLGFQLNNQVGFNREKLEALLKNIRADSAEINFTHVADPESLVSDYLFLIDKYSRSYENIRGSINYDPIARFSRRGIWVQSLDEDLAKAADLLQKTAKLPHFKVIGVNGHIFTNAGATLVQEMAFSLALGAEYLTRLTDRKLSAAVIAPKIKFNLAAGASYFMEMAKFRAYRLLWSNVVNAYGIDDPSQGQMDIHAQNASWNLSLYDPYVNMLRTTTGSMSAILGGVDSFTVLPYNAVIDKTNDFSERIARNQQLILKEESYLDKVTDPAAGSYYIENLTQSLVNEAWILFLKIQEEGGFVEALQKGILQTEIKRSAGNRDADIANRREIFLGTNQYPNFKEMIQGDPSYHVFAHDDKTSENASIETIKLYRGTQAFERMRYKTDIYSKTSKRPVAWMLTFGNLAMHKARANFACNFFACAGFETVDNAGFESVAAGLEAALQSKAEIVVVCSADEEYAEHALSIFNALKDHTIVVLAGQPKELTEELKNAGWEHFIHVKSNVLEMLEKFQKLTSIA